MIRENIAPGEYYHIYNRGNNKQDIFLDTRDYIRFLFLVLYFQSPIIFQNIGRAVSHYVKHRVFNINISRIEDIEKSRYVELVSIALMPNHFHLIVKEVEETGISRYMQRVLNSHTKYFNTKYRKSGHLFQGPYQIVHIETNEQLLYLSAYIHRNPRGLKKWKNREYEYPWSSFQDCLEKNRWNKLLKHDIVTGQFSNSKDYRDYVDTSGAKDEDD